MAPETLRVPPQNIEMEQSVLGCMLMSPDAVDIAMSILKSEHFYEQKNSYIFRAMLDLIDDGEPVDAVTVTDHLTRTDVIDKIGGAYYITGLRDALPSAANVENYCKGVLGFLAP